MLTVIAAAQRVHKSLLVTNHSHHTPASHTPEHRALPVAAPALAYACVCVYVCVASSVRVGLRDAGDTRNLALSGR